MLNARIRISSVQYHPPPPISSCEGPRIIQKLKDVVVQIVELPLYISILFAYAPPPGPQPTYAPLHYTSFHGIWK
jgi:hypothetical protein